MEAYLATAVVLALALLLGGALCSIGGSEGWDWLAPAVGLSATLLIAWLAIRLPGHGTTAAVLLGVAAVAAAVRLLPRLEWRRLAEGALPTLIAGVVSSLPFLASDRIGVLGESVNDDLAFHMDWAYSLAQGGSITGRLPDGYPVGPHAVVAGLAEALGTTAEPAFIGLVLAVPVITALTALAGLEEVPLPTRLLAAPVVGGCYLVAELVLQSSFKELLLGCFVLAFAIVLRRVMRGDALPGHAVAMAGLVSAAACAAFSFAALAWFVSGAALVWAVHSMMTRGREGLRRVGLAAVGMATFVVVATAVLQFAGFFAGGPGRFTFYRSDLVVAGNLPEPLSPFQALSVWPSDEFRVEPDVGWWKLGVALAAVIVLTGLLRAALRREVGLLAVTAVAAAIYGTSVVLSNPYNSAKAMAIAAPVLTATALVGLLGNAGGRGWRRIAPVALAAAWGLLALYSSVVLLRAAPVRPGGQSTDLQNLAGDVAGEPVAFLGQDAFARWELRTADFVYSGGTVDLSGAPGALRGGPVPATARWVVTPRTLHEPTPGPEMRLARTTRWYDAYRRTDLNRSLYVTRQGTAPGAILSCGGAATRALARRGWRALVKPQPVLGPGGAWVDVSGRKAFTNDALTLLPLERTLRQELSLPPGRWELSLRYYSRDPLTVTAGGVSETMPAYLADRTRYWRVGSVTSVGRPIAVSVRGGESRPIQPQREAEIFDVAAVREDRKPRLVPLMRSCGRYVDYVTPP